jgi:transposase-like protein
MLIWQQKEIKEINYMGLRIGPPNCPECQSRNTKMIEAYLYKCLDCDYEWQDPIANFAENLLKGIDEKAKILAEKLHNRF